MTHEGEFHTFEDSRLISPRWTSAGASGLDRRFVEPEQALHDYERFASDVMPHFTS